MLATLRPLNPKPNALPMPPLRAEPLPEAADADTHEPQPTAAEEKRAREPAPPAAKAKAERLEHARLGEPVGDPKRFVDSVSAAAAPLLNRRAFADDDAVGRPGDMTGRPGGWLLAALSSCAAVRTTTCAFFLAASSSQTRATARRFRLPLVHGACSSPPPARIPDRSDIIGFL